MNYVEELFPLQVSADMSLAILYNDDLVYAFDPKTGDVLWTMDAQAAENAQQAWTIAKAVLLGDGTVLGVERNFTDPDPKIPIFPFYSVVEFYDVSVPASRSPLKTHEVRFQNGAGLFFEMSARQGYLTIYENWEEDPTGAGGRSIIYRLDKTIEE